jgi:Fe-S oxidoreductase
MMGYKDLPYEVLQPGEFYYELLVSGKLKIDPAKKIKEPVTLQDPCNIVRRAGAAEKFRYIVNAICEDFREMTPNKEYNFCCNAGGGLAVLAQWTSHKARGNRVKAQQILETGAKIVIAPCHNCNVGLKDVIKYWNLPVKLMFFDELISNTMVIPEELKVKK